MRIATKGLSVFLGTLLLVSTAACGGKNSGPSSAIPISTQKHSSIVTTEASDLATNALSCSVTDTSCTGWTAVQAGSAAPAAQGQSSQGPYETWDLQKAYGFPSNQTSGVGQTVAVVIVGDYANAESDLAKYRGYPFNLPTCSTANGCFRKVNESGVQGNYPVSASSPFFAAVASSSLDMISAICPNCHLLLVEASSTTAGDLMAAVSEAVTLHANVVDAAFGTTETQALDSYEAPYFNSPGVVMVAMAALSSDYNHPWVPAVLPTVVAVGGTTLTPAQNARGFTETVWSGEKTSSGCSSYAGKPIWQHDPGCSTRMVEDVAAVADPNTPVYTYDSVAYGNFTGGWAASGGLSVAAGIIAGAYGYAGASTYLTGAQSLYQNASALNDITVGSNGSCSPAYFCTAGPGYDGPTGNGTPNGPAAFSTPTPPPTPTPAPTAVPCGSTCGTGGGPGPTSPPAHCVRNSFGIIICTQAAEPKRN